MINAYSETIIEPYLYSCANIVTDVNDKFLDLTEYVLSELVGKSIKEVGSMLNFNLKSLEDKINNNYSGYIFTKFLNALEVDISISHGSETNSKLYTFVEKPNSRLNDKLIFVEQMFVDNTSGVAVYSIPDLILLKANQKYLNFTYSNYNKQENSIGKPISEVITGFIGTPAEVICNSVLISQKASYIKEFEFDNITKGKTYWDSTQTPIFDNGKMKYIFHTAVEVTQRVLKNQNIENQNKIINHQNDCHEHEIKSNIYMKEALKSQGEFLVNISHELKTPLNIIFATAQLFNVYCKSGSLDDNKDSIIKYIDSIKQNSYRLSKMINNIVDLSKIETGFLKLNLSNNNIVKFVEDIVMSVTNFTDSKGLNIIFDTNTEEKVIACDQEKIERVVLNLISNAIKFSNAGNEILVNINDKDEFVEISVSDNGIGIEKKNLDMIFDRFKQIDKSLSRNAEGTGIGLSLVKSIVKLHGGTITVESEYGKGSKFTVSLPSGKVSKENKIYNSELHAKDQSIRVELSDVYS
ncbi:HAMP domain-containing histidine kinase [Clostridium frigoris]|uniref:HAMP domain-containing histidine kinase n=1 Tax=Clostridium frigoris TaxID=205327 RepID=A0ABS6BR71_9CLOT|nr:HAMP domain-containing sensor histidine kinase [Clostridium frigoris]MBU3159425.1 HAMP domain-containing histidine kinase [Clostridium frigoris]